MKTYPTLTLTLRDQPNYHHHPPSLRAKAPNHIVSELNTLNIQAVHFPAETQPISNHLPCLCGAGIRCLGILNNRQESLTASGWNDMDARSAQTQMKWRRTQKAVGNVEGGGLLDAELLARVLLFPIFHGCCCNVDRAGLVSSTS